MGDVPLAVALLHEAGDGHAVFRLEVAIRIRGLWHLLTLTYQVLHFTFESAKQKVAALIDGMSFSRIDDHFPETSIEKIRSSMSCLLVEIRSSTHQIQKKGLQARLVGNHLMRGFSGDFNTQIQNARKELTKVAKNLVRAEDKKRNFYLTILLRFKDKLTVLARPESPDQPKSLSDFLEDLEVCYVKSQPNINLTQSH